MWQFNCRSLSPLSTLAVRSLSHLLVLFPQTSTNQPPGLRHSMAQHADPLRRRLLPLSMCGRYYGAWKVSSAGACPAHASKGVPAINDIAGGGVSRRQMSRSWRLVEATRTREASGPKGRHCRNVSTPGCRSFHQLFGCRATRGRTAICCCRATLLRMW